MKLEDVREGPGRQYIPCSGSNEELVKVLKRVTELEAAYKWIILVVVFFPPRT